MSQVDNDNFKIDFIGVGAPKSGSSWIAEAIKEHPDAQLSYTKELTFFNDTGGIYHKKNTNYKKGLDWYRSQYPIKKTKVMGEFSTDYLYDKKAAKRIKKHFPNVKILITLRGPIDKMYSYYWWYKNMDKTETADTFEKAISKNKEYINRSKYYPQLKRYYNNFDKQQIKVILHKDIKNNPKKILTELYEFLEIDKNFIPPLLNKRVNPSRKTKNMKLKYLLNVAKFMRESKLNFIIRILKNSGIYDKLHRTYIKFNMEKFKYPPMRSETRKLLIKELKEDIQKTENLIDKDLSHWLTA